MDEDEDGRGRHRIMSVAERNDSLLCAREEEDDLVFSLRQFLHVPQCERP